MSSMHLAADEWVPLVRDLPPEGKTWTLKPRHDGGGGDVDEAVVQAEAPTATDPEQRVPISQAKTCVMPDSQAEMVSESAPPPPKPGSLAARIESESGLRPLRHLGSGGMGDVVLMEQSRLERPVAVKLLNETRRSGHWLAQFRAEVHATSALEHPAVVPVHDAGDDYLVMKCVEGRTLEELLDGPDRPSLSELIEILVRVGDCIAFAHARGIIHRDLKPSNIMVGEFGETYLMDWGLAIAIGEQAPSSLPRVRTARSVCAGTPAYLAPEVARGRRDLISEAVDAFGLAALLYRILSGRPPWDAADARASVTASATEDRPPLEALVPDAPRELIKLCEWGLEGTPSQRLGVGDFLEGSRHWLRRSGERAEAERLHGEALALLREGEQERIAQRAYRALQAAADRAGRAADLAPGLRAAGRCAEQARFVLARRALAHGDLILARTVVGELEGGQADELRSEIDAAMRGRRRREQLTRRLAWHCRWLVPALVLLGLAFPAFRYVEASQHEAERREQAEAMWAEIRDERPGDALGYQRALARAEQALGLHPAPQRIEGEVARLAAEASRWAIAAESQGLARTYLELATSHGLPAAARDALIGDADRPGTIAYLEAERERRRSRERARRRAVIASLRAPDQARDAGDRLDRLVERLVQWDWDEDDPVTGHLTQTLLLALLDDPDPGLRRLGVRVVGAAHTLADRGAGARRLAAAIPIDRIAGLAADPDPAVAAEAIRQQLWLRPRDEVGHLVHPTLALGDSELREGTLALDRGAFEHALIGASRRWIEHHEIPVPELWIRTLLRLEGIEDPTHPLAWTEDGELHLDHVATNHWEKSQAIDKRLIHDHGCRLGSGVLRSSLMNVAEQDLIDRFHELTASGDPQWRAIARANISQLSGDAPPSDAVIDATWADWNRHRFSDATAREGVLDVMRNAGRYRLALLVALDNARQAEGHSLIQHQWARALGEVKWSDDSIEATWMVNARWPHLALPQTLRARTLFVRKRYVEAEAEVAQAIERSRLSYAVHHSFGIHGKCLLQLGREREALNRYLQSVYYRMRYNHHLPDALRLAYRMEVAGAAYYVDFVQIMQDASLTDAHRRSLRLAVDQGEPVVYTVDVIVALREAAHPEWVRSDLAAAVPALYRALPAAERARVAGREALLAIQADDRATARRWLERAADPTADPFLAVAAAIEAGDRDWARAALADCPDADDPFLPDAELRSRWRDQVDDPAADLVPLALPEDGVRVPPLRRDLDLAPEHQAVVAALLREVATRESWELPATWDPWLEPASQEAVADFYERSPELRFNRIKTWPNIDPEWRLPAAQRKKRP